MKTVIEMAEEAGFEVLRGQGLLPHVPEDVFAGPVKITEEIKRFAELVRADAIAAEREACARVAEDSDHVVGGRGYYDQLGNADATVKNIAAAIRARGSNT